MSAPVRLRDDASCPPELLEALRIAGRAAPSAEQVRKIGLEIQARAQEPERLLEADGEPGPMQQALTELADWKPLPEQRARLTERLAEARGLSKRASPRRAWRPRSPARFAAVGLALLASSAAAAVGWMAIEGAPTTVVAPPAVPAPPAPPRSGDLQVEQRAPAPRHDPVATEPPAAREEKPASREERRTPPFRIDSPGRVELTPPDEPGKAPGNRHPSEDAKSHRRVSTPVPAPTAPVPLGELVVEPMKRHVERDTLRELEAMRATRQALRTDPDRALELAREHRRKYPAGVLAQENDVLLIEALERLNRDAELRSEVDRFRRRYPGSPHLARVEALSRSTSGTHGSAPTP